MGRPARQTAKVLADAVIPNEYGIDPGGKLRIGAKICCALLGKLLADLANMREESLATAARPLTLTPHAPPLPAGPRAPCKRVPGPEPVRASAHRPCAALSLPHAPPASSMAPGVVQPNAVTQ